MTKNILLGFIFCFLAINAQAQDQKILDSLNIIYSTAKHDTTRIMALVDIAHEYRIDKPDTCIALATQALEMSEKIGFERGKGWAISRIARGEVTKWDFAVAMDLLPKAQSYFEKVKDKKGLAWNYNTWGFAYQRQDKPALALEYHQKALKVFEEIEDKKGITNTLNDFAVTYSNQGNYKLALEYHQKALKTFEDIGDKKGIANNLRDFAFTYFNSNYSVAVEYLQRSLKVFQEIGDKQNIATNLSIIAAIYSTQGNYPLALEYYQKALKIFEEIGDKRSIGGLLEGIGQMYSTQGNYPLALEYYQKILKIGEEIGDKRIMGNALINMGMLHTTQGNYPLALEYYQKTLKLFEKIGRKSGIGQVLRRIGEVYNKQGNYVLALEYMQKALNISEERHNKIDIGDILGRIGDIYNAQNNAPLALEYYQKSLKIAEENLGYERGKIFPLKGMAAAYLKQKNYEKSIEYAQKSLQIAQELKFSVQIGEVSKILFESYKLMGNYAKALEYLELHKQTQDSLFSTEKSKAIANLETKAEMDKKQLEIEKEKEATKFQQYINYLVIAGLLSVLVFAFFIFRSRQKEKKAKEEVLQQKEEIQQINEELHSTLETVKVQKTEIENKNQHISDSIRYAQRIQKALLPFEEKFAQHLGKDNFFILYKPKDVVSGDFYFFEEVANKLIIMAVDCTGHGVPGAFMSMIGINLLEEIIISQHNTNPAEILTLLHKKIRFVLKQGETQNTDGMDLSMVVIDKAEKIMEFAGAKNAMIYIQNGELHTLKADKMPIGGEQKEEERIFTKQSVDISQPTTIYLFSDGYQDQFGGKNKKKFMISQMKELFSNFQNTPMSEQQNILDQSIKNWMAEGQEAQIDDILVMGVKI